MQSIKVKWIKRIAFFCLVIFFSYILYLNSLVKSQFSLKVESNKNVVQIQYLIDDYPKELINMLLLVEDQSFFYHRGVDFKEIFRVLYGYLFEEKELKIGRASCRERV